MDGITDLIDMSLSRHREIVKDREACRAAAHGVAESDTTEQLKQTTAGVFVLSSGFSPLRFLQPAGDKREQFPDPPRGGDTRRTLKGFPDLKGAALFFFSSK